MNRGILNKELEERKENEYKEFEEYKECKIFDETKFKEVKQKEIEVVMLGDVSLDEEEKEIMKLNPKFSVLKKLEKEEIENDIEIGLMKARYEVEKRKKYKIETDVEYESYGNKKIKLEVDNYDEEKEDLNDAIERQVYDPLTKVFDYSRKRTTDLK